MRKTLATLTVFCVALALVIQFGGRRTTAAEEKAGSMIIHDVYFTLKDNSAEGRQKLIDACKKYLTRHPGELHFFAGVLGEEFKREVNDRDWDVGLHIIFKDKAAHEEYQESERHKQFIAENKESWKKVRVFDTAEEP